MTTAITDQLETKVNTFLGTCADAFDIPRSKKWQKPSSLSSDDLKREIRARGEEPVAEGATRKKDLVSQLEKVADVPAGQKIERQALDLVLARNLSVEQLRQELQVRWDAWQELQPAVGVGGVGLGDPCSFAFTSSDDKSTLVQKLREDAVTGTGSATKVEQQYNPTPTSAPKCVLVKHSILANLVCIPSEVKRSGPARRWWEGVFERVIQPYKQKYRSGASRGNFIGPMVRRVGRAAFLEQCLGRKRVSILTIHTLTQDDAIAAFGSLEPFRYVRVANGTGTDVFAIPIDVTLTEVRF
jgi:hypothetical protein